MFCRRDPEHEVIAKVTRARAGNKSKCNLMRTPKEIIREYKELRMQLPELVKKSGYKDKHIFEKLEMNKAAFYRRMQKPELWTIEELEKLFTII